MGVCCSKSNNLYEDSTLRGLQNYNIKDHFTDMYNWPGLIFRRGIPFKIEVPISDIINSSISESNISLNLTATGVINLPIIVNNTERDGSKQWFYKIHYNSSDKVILNVTSPSNAIVGPYKLSISFFNKNIGSSEFLLIFNPWNIDDEVYMPNIDDLKEYIMNDSTKLYMGTVDYIIPKEWDLGQFDPQSIQGAIVLLNMMQPTSRASAVSVSRQLSALINANDDNGVVVGNWSGTYGAGVNPMSWTGSSEILGRYAVTRRPVCYGQCWVFCGVLCTVLRTIGIPARCITNYASLHDTDGSLKWEIYLDSNFNPINRGRDSCWNFHCWNEAWLKRSDLGSEHDGWQVLDATPQERSGGLFRVGPASKYAVRHAIINSPYDVGFVFAEVNADKVFFMLQPDGSYKQYMVKKNELGRLVLTKKKFSDEAENITKEYKCTDDNEYDDIRDNEHLSMRRIESSTSRNISIIINCQSSISMTDTLRGSILVNGLSENKESTIKVEALLVSYTGRNICKLYETEEKVSTPQQKIEFEIDHDKLQSTIIEEFPFIRIKVYCFDGNNDELGLEEKIISVKTPDIEVIGVPETCKVDESVIFTIKCQNTLNRSLKDVLVYVKFTDDKIKKIKFKDILPGDTVSQNMVVVPRTVGLKKIQVSLESKNCCGFSNVSKFNAVL